METEIKNEYICHAVFIQLFELGFGCEFWKKKKEKTDSTAPWFSKIVWYQHCFTFIVSKSLSKISQRNLYSIRSKNGMKSTLKFKGFCIMEHLIWEHLIFRQNSGRFEWNLMYQSFFYTLNLKKIFRIIAMQIGSEKWDFPKDLLYPEFSFFQEANFRSKFSVPEKFPSHEV